MTQTWFANRLSNEVRVPRAYARHDAVCMIQSRLPQALQLLLESGGPSDAGLDPRVISELISSLAAPLGRADEFYELYQQDPPVSPVSVYALDEAARVFSKTADNVANGVYALPESLVADGQPGVDRVVKRFRDVAEATDNLIGQLRQVDGALAPDA
ncbi:MAG: hypothetical protein L0H59_01110 [Tomitella sp.]|nr:hypothetical protein [Tomitella sp.]